MCVKCAVIVYCGFGCSMFRMTDMLVLGFRSRRDLYNASCVLVLDVLHAAGYEGRPTFIIAAATNKSKVTVECYTPIQ